MTRLNQLMFSSYLLVLLTACGSSGGGSDGDSILRQQALAAKKVELGELLFEDTDLSTPVGQSCATCHDSDHGFADGSVTVFSPVSEGATGAFGNRNAPTASYASLVPEFNYDAGAQENKYTGGMFLDGRAHTLASQAKGPFLNPKEMNNTDEGAVITKIANATYADLFKEVFGSSSLNNVSTAYNQVAEAIAAYESTEEFQPFTSKFDYFMVGEVSLSATEQRGFDLFNGGASCFECHSENQKTVESKSLLSDFTYRNIGTPSNPNLILPSPDLGLGSVVNESSENGKFRVPTLRNIELTAPYMHNGVFESLEEVVRFYNTRIIDQCGSSPFVGCWDKPEVNENVETQLLGDLSLFETEEADLVAFLKTLTDGYR